MQKIERRDMQEISSNSEDEDKILTMTWNDLKDCSRSYSLPVGGVKSALITHLLTHIHALLSAETIDTDVPDEAVENSSVADE